MLEDATPWMTSDTAANADANDRAAAGPRGWDDAEWVGGGTDISADHVGTGTHAPMGMERPALTGRGRALAVGAHRQAAHRARLSGRFTRGALAALVILTVVSGIWMILLRFGIGGSTRVVRETGQRVQPVITLLSPNGSSVVQQGAAAPLGDPLPGGVGPAPSRYLAPDKPSKYELSLIAAIGTPDKVIVVSKFSQTIHVYDHGRFIAGSYAITGRPQLPTPDGVWHIFLKIAPAVLYSPWPPGSEFYYAPAPVQYTMEFRDGGFLIHDASWHTTWGPGMNDWHYDAGAHEWEWGTHGCVTAPLPFIQWLYNWSPLGTTVIVYE